MSEFWNSRYAREDYAYGTSPNRFFSEQIGKLSPGKVLFAAEGEGRNAVYAAKLGWEVTAFDQSVEGKRKSLLLAQSANVEIEYLIDTYESVSFPHNYFDCIVLVFAHMPAEKRKQWHQKMVELLKPGGRLILQGFSKEQINYTSGGPRDISMLFSEEELRDDFDSLKELQIEEAGELLNEGPYHQGNASVINVFGVK